MSQPLISFVIPAYNVARYIRACLESVYSLDMKGHEREVIVVNDGSTDNTADAIRAIAEEHPDLIVVEQQNMGLSMARNAGTDTATGLYVYYVDGDDQVLANADTSTLIHTLSSGQADIVGIGIMRRSLMNEAKPFKRYDYDYSTIYSPASTFMHGRNLMPCVWAYVWRRQFMVDHALTFKPKAYHEDEDFTPRAFLHAQCFVAVDCPLYLYREHGDSITHTTDPAVRQKKITDLLDTLTRLQRLATYTPEWKEALDCKINYLVVDTIRLLWREGHTRAFRREVIGRLKALGLFPLKWRWDKKYALFNCSTRVLFSYIKKQNVN